LSSLSAVSFEVFMGILPFEQVYFGNFHFYKKLYQHS